MNLFAAKAELRCAFALFLLGAVGVSLTVEWRPVTALAQGAHRAHSQAARADDDDEKNEIGTSSKSGKPSEPHSKRWRISWAVDAYAARIDVKPVVTTIAHLANFKRPADMPKGGSGSSYSNKRVPKIETVLWSVTGTIVGVAAERDGDYRLKIFDGKGSFVICVVPDPRLAPIRSKFSARIDAVRAAVVARFHPTFVERKVSVRATVVGFGYFGRPSPDENPSPEGFQLHPGISIQFSK